ncbi:fimbria/pilus outer membrane usher protein [Rosenbergiella epipactidis]|uniref:fimbria/pilus outer membrane usher protein n=1 Tax=Rosenbergiella epipactidis TaxID=1544694 RepID=UPI001F503022|nr:fimbria/pilus outer membrane usher protein [Rosenbergiella epipactidis]
MNFNPDFIHGGMIDLSRFRNGNPVSPGEYEVSVKINGEDRGKSKIKFRQQSVDQNAVPCLTREQLTLLGIKLLQEKTFSGSCQPIESWIDRAQSYYDSADFVLNLQVPQVNQTYVPRGYIDPARWQQGITAGFIDYNANLYSRLQNKNNDSTRATASFAFNAGFNYAGWRLRKRFNTGFGSKTHWQNLYGYAAHDVTALKSEILLGDVNTSGELFNSVGLRGAVLHSDDLMLPDSQNSYAPVITGIAESNAKVVVMQRGVSIYETVVPPGPFVLRDISGLGYGGDLQLVIKEANGRERIQIIPFSSPPRILQKGITHFSVSAGELKDNDIRHRPRLVQGTYRYGAFSNWTLYGGAQLSEKYRALGIGNAFNTVLGGITFDVIHANSHPYEKSRASGNSYQLQFLRYLSVSQTTLSLAAYRYSSAGYYTISEANSYKSFGKDSIANTDYRARRRLSANLSQRITDSVSLDFNGSYYTYWEDRKPSRQYLLRFNHNLRSFSYSLSTTRTKTDSGREDKQYILSISVPLGYTTASSQPLFSSLYSTVTHSNGGDTQVQTMVSGSQGQQNELSYGLAANTTDSNASKRTSVLDGNISYNTSLGQYGATVTVDSSHNNQFSLSANGSLVAHSGGITAGPALGEQPFAIIEAEGANGAQVRNGYGARIDRWGYAIVPSLSPYRENSVSIGLHDIPDTVDVMENEKTVIPRQGAAVLVKMKTTIGTAMILTVKDRGGKYLPIGVDMLSASGESQGIIGQGGQAYVRGWEYSRQPLFAQVDGSKLRCTPQGNPLSITGTNMVRMAVICQPQ